VSKLTHGILQVLGVVAHLTNLSLVPTKYQPLATAIIGLAQVILALVNHGGTSVQVGK
jgi:hypothetical protein